jgi:hypothetical protein
MFRQSSKFISHKPCLSGGKWFFFGLSFGSILVFVLMHLFQKPSEPVQLIINTPLPPLEKQKPEEYLWSEDGNLGIIEPKPNSQVSSPMRVKGIAKVPENKIYLKLTAAVQDKANQVKEETLGETVVEIKPPGSNFHTQFEASFEFNFKTKVKEGRLKIFGLDKNGVEVSSVIIPVVFN